MTVYDLPLAPPDWRFAHLMPDDVTARTDGEILSICRGEGDHVDHVDFAAEYAVDESSIRAAIAALDRVSFADAAVKAV